MSKEPLPDPVEEAKRITEKLNKDVLHQLHIGGLKSDIEDESQFKYDESINPSDIDDENNFPNDESLK